MRVEIFECANKTRFGGDGMIALEMIKEILYTYTKCTCLEGWILLS